ncbi:hypothetical protein ACP70R_019289 [Stipagrostis hirtigluma subsp. patula]
MPSPATSPASSAGGKPSRSAIVAGTTAYSGHHLLDVEGYSHTKELLPTGLCVKSLPFTVGGRSWRIWYYPNGYASSYAEFISVFLVLDDRADANPPPGVVKARAKLSLLDQAGRPVPSSTRDIPLNDFSKEGHGHPQFIRKAWLERSACLKDDRFTIRCDVLVSEEILRMEKRRLIASSPWSVVVPPPDLHHQIGNLLVAMEGADVEFRVAGETFKAHRCVLAARSPVFKAEFFSAMKESTSTATICVDDMEAKVFSALLGFIYTDKLPPDVQDIKLEEEVAMAQHLLVAADRYDLKRLKLICEDKLCKLIDMGSVATILTLAEQHSCQVLKNACLHFLSSPSTLTAVAATDGFEHLCRSCPNVLKELLSSSGAARVHIHGGEARRANCFWYRVLVIVLCGVLFLIRGDGPLSFVCFVVAVTVAATAYL